MLQQWAITLSVILKGVTKVLLFVVVVSLLTSFVFLHRSGKYIQHYKTVHKIDSASTVLKYENTSDKGYGEKDDKLRSNVYRRELTNISNIHNNNETKHILMWTQHYGRPTFFATPGHFDKCKYRNCEITIDRLMLNASVAVMFHMWDMYRNPEEMPPYHLPHQYWLLFGRESPQNIRVDVSMNGVFNLTDTYRSDSDMHLAYGALVDRSRELPFEAVVPTRSRRKLVAWIVSHCGAVSWRDAYVRSLSRYIPIDIYGKCGNLTCGTDRRDSAAAKQCISGNYKFYLAPENSLCWEYISEKTWSALSMDVIPIVIGYANYSKFLPPHSYIDVHDFSSPEKLADYLLRLDSDEDLYNSYFRWKTTQYATTFSDHLCQFCEFLNTKRHVLQIYMDIDKWWNPMCITPTQYYRNVADDIADTAELMT